MKKILMLLFVFSLTTFSVVKLNAFTPPASGESFVYPNPSSGTTAYVAFNMAESGKARFLIYNESGTLVRDEENTFSSGIQQGVFYPFFLAPGAYLYRLLLIYDSGATEKLSGKFLVTH